MPETTLFYVSYVALWGLVLFQTLVLLELVRRASGGRQEAGGAKIERPEMLESGTPAPTFEAPDVSTGREVSSAVWLGRYTLLLFVTPNCPACKMATADVESLRERVDARLVVLCRGDGSQCREFGTSYFPGATTLLDEAGEVGGRFKVSGTPTAVLLDDEWRVRRYGFSPPGSERELAVASVEVGSNSSRES